MHEQLQDPEVKREYDALEAEYAAKQASLLCTAVDLVRSVEAEHHPGIYQKRNERILDQSVPDIAVFNGQQSETKNTIEYAEQRGVPLFCIQRC